MKITIETDVLIAEALEPQHYIWLYLQFIGDINTAWLVSPISLSDLEYLETQQFIKITGSGAQPLVFLRTRALNLFEVNIAESNFDTFWSTFPMKVPNGNGGYRILRAKENSTRDYEEAKKKYLLLAKNDPGLHEKIMKGLENQLILERGKLQFMNNILTWLNQKVWERFYHLDVDINEDEKVKGI